MSFLARLCAGSVVLITACGDAGSAAPCPRPPAALVPESITVAVGGPAVVAIPAANRSTTRALQWTIGDTAIASVLATQVQDSATVRGLRAGATYVQAVDRLSLATCPDFWQAKVVVR